MGNRVSTAPYFFVIKLALALLFVSALATGQTLRFNSKDPNLQETLEDLASRALQNKKAIANVSAGIVATVSATSPLCSSGGANPNITFCSSIAESQVTNLVSDLAAKAQDSLVCHLAGNETLTGAKAFTAPVVFVSSASHEAPEDFQGITVTSLTITSQNLKVNGVAGKNVACGPGTALAGATYNGGVASGGACTAAGGGLSDGGTAVLGLTFAAGSTLVVQNATAAITANGSGQTVDLSNLAAPCTGTDCVLFTTTTFQGANKLCFSGLQSTWSYRLEGIVYARGTTMPILWRAAYKGVEDSGNTYNQMGSAEGQDGASNHQAQSNAGQCYLYATGGSGTGVVQNREANYNIKFSINAGGLPGLLSDQSDAMYPDAGAGLTYNMRTGCQFSTDAADGLCIDATAGYWVGTWRLWGVSP